MADGTAPEEEEEWQRMAREAKEKKAAANKSELEKKLEEMGDTMGSLASNVSQTMKDAVPDVLDTPASGAETPTDAPPEDQGMFDSFFGELTQMGLLPTDADKEEEVAEEQDEEEEWQTMKRLAQEKKAEANKSALEKQLEAMEDTMGSLASNVSQTMKDAGSLASDMSQTMKEAVPEGLNFVGDTGDSVSDSMKEMAPKDMKESDFTQTSPEAQPKPKSKSSKTPIKDRVGYAAILEEIGAEEETDKWPKGIEECVAKVPHYVPLSPI